jgi:hypothetical protein
VHWIVRGAVPEPGDITKSTTGGTDTGISVPDGDTSSVPGTGSVGSIVDDAGSGFILSDSVRIGIASSTGLGMTGSGTGVKGVGTGVGSSVGGGRSDEVYIMVWKTSYCGAGYFY